MANVYSSAGTSQLSPITITASRAVVSDSGGLPTAATTTAAEIGFVSGVSSAIQTQLNAKLSSTTAPNSFKGNNTGSTTSSIDLSVLQANTLLTVAVFNAGNSGTTLIFNWNNGPYQYCALTATCSFGFSNAVSGAVYQIEITQGASSFTAIYPSSLVTYSGGYSAIPNVTATASALDLINLAYNGAATKYRLTMAQNLS